MYLERVGAALTWLQTLETFCLDCGVAACLSCAVFKHNGHAVKALAEAAVPIKARALGGWMGSWEMSWAKRAGRIVVERGGF